LRRARGSRRAGVIAFAALLFAAACSPAPAVAPAVAPPVPAPPRAPLDAAVPAPSAAPTAPAAPAEEGPTPEEVAEARAKVDAMVSRVAQARGLPVRREVASRVLDREQILARIRAHVDRDIPKDVVDHQGEVLAALELVPPSYDFIEGSYKLIQGRIAGFYEPADRTMYLVDDLGDAEAEQTLAHELVHALQDQSYDLDPLLKYAPGDSDRITAVHALIEGDATSAMLDVVAGSAFNISEATFRRLLSASTTLSMEGLTTPHILQASLTAPYADGFSFVQQRRQKGGWPAVDAAFRALPTTTEQLLHADKYEAREPAIPVAVPSIEPLGSGFHAVLDDVMGEQGLRLMLEEWTTRARAVQAAAGWGGDRLVVARRDAQDQTGRHEIAIGWRLVFDTDKDALEFGDALKGRFGEACRERPQLGPLTWKRKGREVAIAVGPFERALSPRGTKGTGSCKAAEAWARALLAPVTPVTPVTPATPVRSR
jgi:hypothetical protein